MHKAVLVALRSQIGSQLSAAEKALLPPPTKIKMRVSAPSATTGEMRILERVIFNCKKHKNTPPFLSSVLHQREE
jgi:hypothetical protein